MNKMHEILFLPPSISLTLRGPHNDVKNKHSKGQKIWSYEQLSVKRQCSNLLNKLEISEHNHS